jgi:hypothetical protein
MFPIKELIKNRKVIQQNFQDIGEIIKKYGGIDAFYKDKEYFQKFLEENKRNNFRVFDMVYLLWSHNGQLAREELLQKHQEFTKLNKISSLRALQILLEKHVVLQISNIIILPKEVHDYFTNFYKSQIGELKTTEIKIDTSKEMLEEMKRTNYYGLSGFPKNEEEVKFLFARNLEKLNILRVIRIEQYFPDATVIVSENGVIKRVYIEFEYNSASFIAHGHLEQMKILDINPKNIWVVCWEHDGKLPKDIEVKELKKVIA